MPRKEFGQAPLGNDRYRLWNTPFYAFGISVEDVVVAKDAAGQFIYHSVLLRGGHSTYRLIVKNDARVRFAEYWAELQKLGCTYEQATDSL